MLCLNHKAGEEDLPLVPPRRGEKLYMVPQGIRPVVQLTAIEVHYLAIMGSCFFLCFAIFTRQRQTQQAIRLFCSMFDDEIFTFTCS